MKAQKRGQLFHKNKRLYASFILLRCGGVKAYHEVATVMFESVQRNLGQRRNRVKSNADDTVKNYNVSETNIQGQNEFFLVNVFHILPAKPMIYEQQCDLPSKERRSKKGRI